MTKTTTSSEFIQALTHVLNSAVSAARAQRAVNSEKHGTATQEDSVAARRLDTLQTQFDTLCNVLYLVTPPGVLNDLLDDLDNAIIRGDVELVEKIRDYELAVHSPEVSRVRDIDGQIRDIESQISILRFRMDGLEEERARASVAAVESGFTKEQIISATGRDAVAVNRWLRGE